MGRQGSVAQTMITSASSQNRSGWAGIVGLITLIVTASGIFSELQTALNAIWRTKQHTGTVSRLVRARLASLGLVMTLGFLLLVSLVVSMIALLFGLVYKILPDTSLAWRDVAAGAIATAVLFNVGKFLIGLYLGSSSVASSFGAAGALALLLLWIYTQARSSF